MKILRVVGWTKHFETHRTRELKYMTFVPVPTKQDSHGYCVLVDHPNGAAHLGCWLAILEIAAKCHPRGTLARDSRTNTAHTPRSLAVISRLPATMFQEVIPRLLEIGWLEEIETEGVTEIPRPCAEIPRSDAASRARAERNGTERNGLEQTGTEEKGTGSSLYGPSLYSPSLERTDWDDFRDAYPIQTHVEGGCRAYVSRISGKEGEHLKLIAGLSRYLLSTKWLDENGELDPRRIPHMEAFIADGLYLDTPPVWKPQKRRQGRTVEERLQATGVVITHEHRG